MSACVLTGAGVLATTAYVSHQAMHPLPVADQWDTVPDYQSFLQGELGLRELWATHNEHRILLPRLFFLADYHWFRGQLTFLILSIYVLQLAHALLLCRLAWRWSELRRPDLVIAAGLVLSVMMSASQRQTLNWSFQVPVPLVHLAATLAFLSLALLARSSSRQPRTATSWGYLGASSLAATLATYSMANGLFVWPVLIAVALLWRLPFRHIAVLSLVAVAVGVSFLFQHPVLSRPGAEFELTEVLRFASIYLGNPLFPWGSLASQVVGTLVLAAIVAAGVLFLFRPSTNPLVGTCIQILAFVLITVLVTALSRAADFGDAYAFQSRYCTTTLIAWSALILLVFHFGGGILNSHGWWKPVVGTGAVVVLLSALWRIQAIEVDHAPKRLRHLESLTERFLAGESSDELFEAIHPNRPERVRDHVEFLRAQELGIYARWGARATER